MAELSRLTELSRCLLGDEHFLPCNLQVYVHGEHTLAAQARDLVCVALDSKPYPLHFNP